jgi:hypothetical protein
MCGPEAGALLKNCSCIALSLSLRNNGSMSQKLVLSQYSLHLYIPFTHTLACRYTNVYIYGTRLNLYIHLRAPAAAVLPLSA